jgi:voltage-gated potassium channel
MPDGEQLIMQGSKLMLIGSGESIRLAKKIARKKQKPREMQYV